jgi:membrane protein implicated in regulation of membrane protease activity
LVARILYPEWGPIVAGAIAAAALALVLHVFAVAIGLSASSTAPTWRDASFALVLLSGLYLVLAALASYGLGGYLAGLMCTRLSSREDADLRDGLHGLLVWALATLLTALIGLATAAALAQPTDEPSDHERGQQERDDRAHANEHIGENYSGAVLDGHDARRRFASMPLYGQWSGSLAGSMH